MVLLTLPIVENDETKAGNAQKIPFEGDSLAL